MEIKKKKKRNEDYLSNWVQNFFAGRWSSSNEIYIGILLHHKILSENTRLLNFNYLWENQFSSQLRGLPYGENGNILLK